MATAAKKAPQIFLVEDDLAIRHSLIDVLEEEGYSVQGAGDADVALANLRAMREKPRLILLDLRLPGKDGVEFRREQRADASLSTIPVLLLSADGPFGLRSAALSGDELLHKPVDLEKLIGAVRRYVE